MHCNNSWKKNIPQKVKKRWNMTVNLALTQQWLQLTCICCECGAEPFTFSCSISGCHCHCVFSLSTPLPSPLLLLTPHICTTIWTQPEGAGGWAGGHEAGAGQGRAGQESSPAHPPAEHCFLPAFPQEHGLSWRLLCSTPCILPVQTQLLSGGCLTPWSCCSKPCTYKPAVLLHAWELALSLETWRFHVLHITLHASSQNPVQPAGSLQALLPGLKQLPSAPWAAPCTSLSPKCPLAPQEHPSLSTEPAPLPAHCSCPAQTSWPSCLWARFPPSPFPLIHAEPRPMPSSDPLLFFRQM